VLSLLARLTHRPRRADGVTASVLYRAIDRERPTLLIDEADNLDLATTGALRAVLNAGHHQDGTIWRTDKGIARPFAAFAPVAIAAIRTLPLPLMHRSIVIRMERASADQAGNLTRLDTNNAEQMAVFATTCQIVRQWARRCNLTPNPPMPDGLHNRRADNWRALISTADACGPAAGASARQAAVAMSRDHQDEDYEVMLLEDLRRIFNGHGVDRLASEVLVNELNGIEDGNWCEWRGIRDDQQPRRLTQPQLSKLLGPFGIKSRVFWPSGMPRPTAKSKRGYYRTQFEAAWASYCYGDTPSQPRSVKHSRRCSPVTVPTQSSHKG
jgi:hypothetical protein